MGHTKEEYTKKMLELLPDDNVWKQKQHLNAVMIHWWTTGRLEDGLRLSDPGKEVFEEVGIQHYEFPIETDPLNNLKLLSSLSKYLETPYYLVLKGKDSLIRVYDTIVAAEIALYDSPMNYLESFEQS